VASLSGQVATATADALPSSAPAIPPAPATAAVWQSYVARSHGILAGVNREGLKPLPAPPRDVTDLDFAEFFGPVGDRGLEYSAKLRALDGQRVRLAGFMIREPGRPPGLFRFSSRPLAQGRCATDQPPPSTVHVCASADAVRVVPYQPGRLVLIGRLELGPRLEADGRNSVLRLILDEGTPGLAVVSRD
jgi:hypothetical protein